MNTPVRSSDVKPATLFDAPPPIGHNHPPPFDPVSLAERIAEANSFVEAGGEWLDLKNLENEEQAQNLVDFIDGLKKQDAKVEKWRVDAKAPHIAAGKAVDKAVEDLKAMLERTKTRALTMDTAWKIKERARKAAEAKVIADKAAADAAEAEQLRLQAIERNDISGEVEAEKKAAEAQNTIKAADKSVAEAGRTKSASGAGRTTALFKIKTARIDNIRLAFMAVQDSEIVVEAVQRALNQKIRAAGFTGTIAGVTIEEREQAR